MSKPNIAYNNLQDDSLKDQCRQKATSSQYITTYITNEQELDSVKDIFDAIFTNELNENSIFKKCVRSNSTISSVQIPSELASFIKNFKTIKDKNKFLDQFRLFAILNIADVNNGNYAFRDFLHDGDILNLRSFFALHKNKLMDYVYFQSFFAIICDENIDINGNRVFIIDIDDFIESISPLISMLRQLFTNSLAKFHIDNSNKTLIAECIKKHFKVEKNYADGSKKQFFAFLMELLENEIPASIYDFFNLYVLDDQNLKKYMESNKLDSFDFFDNIEKK